MPIPEERLPQADESYEDRAVESASYGESLSENEELEFESADADTSDDEPVDSDETSEPDTGGFGFGDPAD